MLVDTVTIIVRGGNGGNGAATLRRTGQTAKGGPDGGNGGNGGNVYVQGSHNLTDLREFRYKKKVIASDGAPGRRSNMFGKSAPHTTFYVPLGTQITDIHTGKSFEIDDATLVLIASGGKGGRGNNEFKSATNQTPRYAEPGGIGEEKRLLLNLRFIATIGLIGLPNAGKSSILAALTNATPAIGNYPFTTLEPNIGMFGTHPIADIPGLIEGAATGRGLGVKFLKHIEKTKILVHCIDLTIDSPEEAYKTVRREFEQYNPQLLEKPELILLNKTDLVDDKKIKKHDTAFKKRGMNTLTCSIYDPKSIEALKQTLLAMIST